MRIAHFLRNIACLFFLFLSCRTEENHLPPAEMEQILLDVHIAESYSSLVGKDSTKDLVSKNEDSLAAYYRAVFAHHHTTLDQFSKSMDWYREHPEELDTIYSHIIRRFDQPQRKPGVTPGR